MKQIVKLIQLLFLSAISSYIGYGQTNTYLAPVSVPPGYEQFNNNQGIRAIWGAPAYSESRDVVKFSSTISNGESLYFDISNTGNVYFIGLSGSASETNIYSEPQGNPNIIFGMSVGLNNTAQAYEGGISTGPTITLTSGNTLKISYSGSTIQYQKSTDGINYTTFHTSNNVANGVYTVYFEAPPQGAGPDNLYKNGTAVIPSYAYVYKVKADSVKITNDNCNAELIIENSTKHIQGFLYNYGNGRTQFRKISQKINDSIFLIGNDTLRLSGGSKAAINGLTDSLGFTKLGGTLIETTIINGAGFRTHFTDTISTNKELIIYHPTFTQQRQFSIGMGPGSDTMSLYLGWNMPKNLSGGGLAGRNLIIGNWAGSSLTTARFNMAIGLSALAKNQTASFQTGIGIMALQNLVSGQDNFALGDGVFALADTGSYNYGSGSQVGQRFRKGIENTAVGNYAFGKSPGGNGNTVLGAWALYGIHGNTDTSHRNTIIGSRAMHLNNGGDDNIALGYRAGYNYNGNGKLFIHNDSMYNPLIGGDFATRRLGINQNAANINYTIDAIIPAGENNYFSLKRINDSIKLAHIIQGKTTFTNDSIFLSGQTRISTLAGSGDRMVVAGPNGDLTTQSIAGGGGTTWSLNGNTGTNFSNNFIGTIDNQKLVFRTKNLEHATIDTLGNFGLGVTNPQYKLHVNGNAAFGSMIMASNLSRPGDRIRFGRYLNNGDGQNVLIETSSDSGNTYKNILVERDGWVGLGMGNGLGWNVGNPALRIAADGNVGVGSNSFRLGNFGGPNNASHLIMYVSNVNEYEYGTSYPNGQNYYYFGTALVSPLGQNKRAPLKIASKQLEFNTGGNNDVEAGRFSENGNLLLGTTTDANYKLQVKGTAKIDSMPFLANRDTVLTYDPVTKQIKVTKVASAVPTTSSVYILNQLTASATAAVPATGLSFPVTAGIFYKFKFVLVFRTAATGTGIKLGLTTPGFTVFSANADIPIAADGAAGLYSGWLTTSGDVVTGTGVQTINTDYTAIIEGIISPSANGTVQLIFGSEVAGSLVTLRPGCIINIEPYGLN